MLSQFRCKPLILKCFFVVLMLIYFCTQTSLSDVYQMVKCPQKISQETLQDF